MGKVWKQEPGLDGFVVWPTRALFNWPRVRNGTPYWEAPDTETVHMQLLCPDFPTQTMLFMKRRRFPLLQRYSNWVPGTSRGVCSGVHKPLSPQVSPALLHTCVSVQTEKGRGILINVSPFLLDSQKGLWRGAGLGEGKKSLKTLCRESDGG